MSEFPVSGGRFVIDSLANGGGLIHRSTYHDRPKTPDEARFFAKWDDLSKVELMRRLRTAEWNAEHYQREAEGLSRAHRAYPPMYEIQKWAACVKRVRALLDVPRRRTIPKSELREALYPDRWAND